ncbi:MAG: hypothetical protein UZ21_OP11001000307 [Microgenomates bacterium OLB22]|nr:MAG: hypothetical protein UZ21_OP11001000307 [Microgenomates bacterium OLB22]
MGSYHRRREVKDLQDFDAISYPIEPHKHVFVRRDKQLYRVYSFVQILAPVETTEKTIEVGVVGQEGKTEKRTYGVAAEEIRDEPFTFHFDRVQERLSIRLNQTFLHEYGLLPIEIEAHQHLDEEHSDQNASIEATLFSGGTLDVLPGNPSHNEHGPFLRIRAATKSGNIKEVLIRQIEVEQDGRPDDQWDPTEGQLGTISIEPGTSDFQVMPEMPSSEIGSGHQGAPTKIAHVDLHERAKRYSAREAMLATPKESRLATISKRIATFLLKTKSRSIEQSNKWQERWKKRQKPLD